MSALGVLVIVAFGLVCIQQLLLVFGTLADDFDGGCVVAGLISVPIALIVIGAFIVALIT